MTRPSIDAWGLGVARAIATRGECTRRQVGAVILDSSGRICGAGYNGVQAGKPSCLTGACPRGRHYEIAPPPGTIVAGFTKCACGKDWDSLYGGCPDAVQPGSSYDTGPGMCLAVHAEANALLDADPLRRKGGTMYISEPPCDGCKKLIGLSGVSRVVAPDYEWIIDGT